MFEAEYKKMMDNVTPDSTLITNTLHNVRPSQSSTLARRRIRPLLVIMLIAAGILGASALAINGIRVIDWAGNVATGIDKYDHLKPENAQTLALRDTAWDALKDMPSGELWLVTVNGRKNIQSPYEEFLTFDEMKQRIKIADPELMLPSVLPEGYTFDKGELHFFISEAVVEAGISLLSDEITEDGVRTEKYRLPDITSQYVCYYFMYFTNKDGKFINIRCERTGNASRSTFTLWEGEDGEVVTVEGMNKSIYITDSNGIYPNQLNLRKTGMTPRRFFRLSDLLVKDYLKRDSGGANFYEAAEYSLEASDIDKDELITIAESFQ